MGKNKGTFSLLLIVILAFSSLIMIEHASAQNTQTITPLSVPDTPDFTIEITNSSYYVPVTHSVDPSTGQEVANNSYYSGYVDALNVTITIKNQPLALSTKSDEYNGFKYFIELKPHNSVNWTSLTWSLNGLGLYQSGGGFLPSNSTLTTLTFQFSDPYFPVNHRKEYPENSSGLTYATNPFFPTTVNKNEPVDFRVRAGIGDFSYLSMGQLIFEGNYSDWNKQTLTMANGETSTSSNLSPTPNVPEFSWLTILPLLLAIPIVLVIIRKNVSRNITLWD